MIDNILKLIYFAYIEHLILTLCTESQSIIKLNGFILKFEYSMSVFSLWRTTVYEEKENRGWKWVGENYPINKGLILGAPVLPVTSCNSVTWRELGHILLQAEVLSG